MSEMNPAIFQHWIHSHEEDSAEVKVYRPAGYNFPRARGRRGFKVNRNGEFIFYDYGPDDRSRAIRGHYTIEGKNKIRARFVDAMIRSCELEILSLNKDVLKAKIILEWST